PGAYQEKCREKTDGSGGAFLKVSSRTLALSQTCVCGRREKKPLSQRIHACPECGFTAQRDLLSAALLHAVAQGDDGKWHLDARMAATRIPGTGPLLAAAASRADKTAKAKAARPSALGFGRGNAVRRRRCSSALADLASLGVPRRRAADAEMQNVPTSPPPDSAGNRRQGILDGAGDRHPPEGFGNVAARHLRAEIFVPS
ncbi:MAG: transposase, partial [Desulfovibrio sp.]|nr:transposase [Desulfovibrio sp.]